MPGIGEAAEDVSEQTTSNIKPGLGGGLAMGLGRAFGGNTLGPIAGGLAASYFLEGQDADTVTQVGMMLGASNAVAASIGGSGGSSNSGGRRRV